MEVTFCATKAGKGFKIVVDGVWLYTSKSELYRVLQNKALACQFREIDKEVAQEQQAEMPALLDHLRNMLILDLLKPCNKDLILNFGGVKFCREWAINQVMKGGERK